MKTKYTVIFIALTVLMFASPSLACATSSTPSTDIDVNTTVAPVITVDPKITNSNKAEANNNNLNLVHQSQGQDQDQKQSQGQLQGQAQKTNVEIDNPRSFLNPANITYAPLGSMIEPPDKGAYYWPIQEIISYRNNFNLDQFKQMTLHSVWNRNSDVQVFAIAKSASSTTTNAATVVSDLKDIGPKAKVETLGYISVQVKAKDLTSFNALGLIGMEAVKMGANYILITNQGVWRKGKQSTIGLGMVGNASTNTTDSGTQAGLSIGPTSTTSYNIQLPWMHAVALYVE